MGVPTGLKICDCTILSGCHGFATIPIYLYENRIHKKIKRLFSGYKLSSRFYCLNGAEEYFLNIRPETRKETRSRDIQKRFLRTFSCQFPVWNDVTMMVKKFNLHHLKVLKFLLSATTNKAFSHVRSFPTLRNYDLVVSGFYDVEAVYIKMISTKLLNLISLYSQFL